MAKPAVRSADAPAYFDDPIIKLITGNPGNWFQYGGDRVSSDAAYFYGWKVDGQVRTILPDIGGVFARQSPEQFAQTKLLNSFNARYFSYSDLTPGPHNLQFQVICATHSPAYGNEPEWWEFGAVYEQDPTRYYIIDVPVTVGATPEPPATLPDDLNEMCDMTDTERALSKATSFQKVVEANPLQWIALLAWWDNVIYQGKTDYPEPNITVHAFRWMMGVGKESAIAHKYNK